MVRHQNLLVIVAILWLAVIILAIKMQKHESCGSKHFSIAPGSASLTIAYGPHLDKQANLLDLCLPEEVVNQGPYPVIVFIHGGGWEAGDKSDVFYQRQFNRHGYAVVSLNYRLAQEAPFPAQIEDCKKAITWLRVHAKTLRINPDRIGVWGVSAGGHLAALLGTTGDASTPAWAKRTCGVSNKVQAVCDWCGPTDLTTMAGQAGSQYRLAPAVNLLLRGTPEEKVTLAREASPVNYAHGSTPPILIMHGDKDDVVPIQQSMQLEKALQAKRVNCTLEILAGAGHAFATQDNMERVVNFFDTTLKKN